MRTIVAGQFVYTETDVVELAMGVVDELPVPIDPIEAELVVGPVGESLLEAAARRAALVDITATYTAEGREDLAELVRIRLVQAGRMPGLAAETGWERRRRRAAQPARVVTPSIPWAVAA
ncbi:hypothetical protein [Embleya hyalina]|uniref:Uncharacterized protein n=1 Tax=Embleya hyalina TaxID=516124 RepID=A0A401Z3X3_9ACTN|nr:hypothetical protein [Embleya hyalina]GCE01547.1 hypothetical protein EHYA_09313 [Embleya hyalina]